MRRSIITLATTAALAFATLPAAGASSVTVELPADVKIGSSAAESLSSGDNTGSQTRDNILDLGKDWLFGAVLATVLGGLINLVVNAS